MEIEIVYSKYLASSAVVTDSRQIISDCLFFALRGNQFDGNQFARQALEQGAKFVVIDDPAIHQLDDPRYILVSDTLKTLQDLATFHRSKLSFPVIGLTGTNGKTTTKELIRSVLAEGFRVQATRGNFNNHIGVPLTVLDLAPAEIDIAIVEMGANHIGEIELLCKIAQPTHGLITNIGRAHLEGFGSIEGVKKGKGELYEYLWRTNGTLFIQADNATLIEVAQKTRGNQLVIPTPNDNVKTYGPDSLTNEVYGEVISADPFLKVTWTNNLSNGKDLHEIDTQLAGSYNLENILAAIRIGLYFGLSAEQINRGISNYKPSNNRSQVVDSEKGNRIIGDFYNANASSMSAALDSFSKLNDERPKVIILGDMFEMGDHCDAEHAMVIERALRVDASTAIFVGQHFYAQMDAAKQLAGGTTGKKTTNVYFYQTLAEAKQEISETHPIEDSIILLKGSRGIAMEGLLEVL